MRIVDSIGTEKKFPRSLHVASRRMLHPFQCNVASFRQEIVIANWADFAIGTDEVLRFVHRVRESNVLKREHIAHGPEVFQLFTGKRGGWFTGRIRRLTSLLARFGQVVLQAEGILKLNNFICFSFSCKPVKSNPNVKSLVESLSTTDRQISQCIKFQLLSRVTISKLLN